MYLRKKDGWDGRGFYWLDSENNIIAGAFRTEKEARENFYPEIMNADESFLVYAISNSKVC